MKFETLKEILEKNLNGAGFIGLVAQTPVKLKGGKKNPQQGRIYKVIKNGNCILFQNKQKNGYSNMIRRRLEKEGIDPDNFKLGKRPWGKRLPNLPIVEHKGNYYLEAIFNQAPKVEYLIKDENGFRPISKDEIIGLPETKKAGKQGGLSDKNKVVIRTFKVDNIKELHFNGEIIR